MPGQDYLQELSMLRDQTRVRLLPICQTGVRSKQDDANRVPDQGQIIWFQLLKR